MHAFCFFIRGDDNQVIAGCNGFLMFNSVYTDQLWVHPKYRKLGLGSNLIKHVHDYACVNACAIATVVTMSFQGAIEFYEKLRYEVDFERDGYINGSSCVFLKKMFKQENYAHV
jgi:ribosomal protein S18 acetylase RimI-like enzyme